MRYKDKNKSAGFFPIFKKNQASRQIVFILFSIQLIVFFLSIPLTYLNVPVSFSSTWEVLANFDTLVLSPLLAPDNFPSYNYSVSFLVAQAACFLVAGALSYLRLIHASFLIIVVAIFIFLLAYNAPPNNSELILKVGLTSLALLFFGYFLLSFYAEYKGRRQMTNMLCQYIPPELVSLYSDNPEAVNLKGESRELTVMFCDIQGFSTISESLSPRELATWLNDFFSMASEIIIRYEGTIDKYMGDCIMAFWGAPVPNPDHASAALEAAMEIQRELIPMNERFKAEGKPEIHVGIGLSSGETNVGNIGSKYRMAYTVIGDTVNTAERLESQTRTYKVPIILSKETALLIPGIFFRDLDVIRVKGKKKHVKLLEPVCNKLEATPQIKQYLSLHQKAILHYRKRNYDKAERLFRILQRLRPNDYLYQLYLHKVARKKARRNVS